MEIIARYDTIYRGGQTRRERNEDMDKDDLSPVVELSTNALKLFQTYFRVAAERPSAMSGVEPLGSGLIREWCESNGVRLDSEEKRILSKMDQAYRKIIHDEQELYRKADEEARRSGAKEYR